MYYTQWCSGSPAPSRLSCCQVSGFVQTFRIRVQNIWGNTALLIVTENGRLKSQAVVTRLCSAKQPSLWFTLCHLTNSSHSLCQTIKCAWSAATHYWHFSKMCCHVDQTGVLTTQPCNQCSQFYRNFNNKTKVFNFSPQNLPYSAHVHLVVAPISNPPAPDLNAPVMCRRL